MLAVPAVRASGPSATAVAIERGLLLSDAVGGRRMRLKRPADAFARVPCDADRGVGHPR